MPNIIRCQNHANYDTHSSSLPTYATLRRKAGVEDRGGCIAEVGYADYVSCRQKLADAGRVIIRRNQSHSQVLLENATSMARVLELFICFHHDY